MADLVQFGREVQARRSARDFTQRTLATTIGCAVITLKKIEAGQLRPSQQIVERLADALGVTANDRPRFIRLARGAIMRLGFRNPYKGLRAFQEDDAQDFFGRETLIQRLSERLAEPQQRFLALVGPSGSGKSSVLAAGLIPTLRSGAVHGSEFWIIVRCTPGYHPLENLSDAMRHAGLNPLPQAFEAQHDELAHERGASESVAITTAPVLIILDQFEELYTLVQTEAERIALLQFIRAAITAVNSQLRVLIALRADFYDRPLRDPLIADLLDNATLLMLPLSPDELARACTAPAAQIGLHFEPTLLAVIVSDIAGQPNALPLLQYTLTELVEHSSDTTLTLVTYQAIGGVPGALARRAEALFADLPTHVQAVTQQLFLQLVQVNAQGEATRRRARIHELVVSPPQSEAGDSLAPTTHGEEPLDVLQHVLATYSTYRLLTFDRDHHDGTQTVELAHEALLSAWERLANWIGEARLGLSLQQRLRAVTAEWVVSSRAEHFLATPPLLDQYLTIVQNKFLLFSADEHAFLKESCRQQADKEQAERARQEHELALARHSEQAQRRAADRLRWLVGVLVFFLIITVALSSFAFQQQQAAVQNLANAEARRLTVEARRLLESGGSPEVIALLGLHSLHAHVTAEGISVLDDVNQLPFPSQILHGHTDTVNAIALTPDGTRIVSAASDGTVRVWDRQTGALLHILEHERDPVLCVALSPDGMLLVSADTGRTIRVWDLATGVLYHTFTDVAAPTRSLAFTADGTHFVSASDDGVARLWSISDGTISEQFMSPQGALHSIAISGNGGTLATGGVDRVIEIRDLHTGQVQRTLPVPADDITYLSFFANNQWLLSASSDGIARIWNVTTGQVLYSLQSRKGALSTAGMSNDQKYVFLADVSGAVRLWDIQGEQVTQTFTGGTSPAVAALTPDGHTLVGANGAEIRLWELAHTVSPSLPAPQPAKILCAAFLPGTSVAVTGDEQGQLQVRNAPSGVLERVIATNASPITSIAVTPDGKYLLSGSRDGTLRLWDAHTYTELKQWNQPDSIISVAISPDGVHLVTGSALGMTRVWETNLEQPLHTFDNERSIPVFVAFLSNDDVLLSENGATRQIWHIQQPLPSRRVELFTRFGVRPFQASSVVSTADGSLLAGYYDATVRYWNKDNHLKQQISGHTDIVTAVAVSSEYQMGLTGSADGTARVWDLASGREVRLIHARDTLITAVTFSPDARLLITGDADGNVAFWPRTTESLIALVCAKLQRDATPSERAQYQLPNVAICAK